VTVKVLPAIVSVPVRADWLALTATEKVTAPEPVTDDGEVIVNQFTFALAFHAQAAPAVTFSDPDDAADVTDSDRVDSEGVQGADVAKTLEDALGEAPPGPTAVTLA
jgi:hypothetical protein